MAVKGEREMWEAGAAAVLRHRGTLADGEPDTLVWQRLSRRTVEDLPLPALGVAGDDRTLLDPRLVPPARPTRGLRCDVRCLVADSDPATAARSALAQLDQGATSVWLRVGGGGVPPAEVALALAGVRIDAAPVVLSVAETLDPVNVATCFAALLDDGQTPVDGTSFGVDPVGRLATDAYAAEGVAEVVATVADLALPRSVGAFTVDTTVAHERGAAEIGELAFGLAAGVTYLRLLERAGVALERAVDLLEFRFAMTADQYLGIAKLRAARRLWYRVLEAGGGQLDRYRQRVHAVTSRPMLTRYGSWNNVVRSTLGAVAALVGGADAITVLPRTGGFGQPTPADALRLARNTALVLQLEAQLTDVADPAGGAWALEELTESLADAAWAGFQRVEAAGGLLNLDARSALLTSWQHTAQRRADRLARRSPPVLGITKYCAADDKAASAGSTDEMRWSHSFEQLRDVPVRPPVPLIILGTDPRSEALASVARDVLAAGGLAARDVHIDAAGGGLSTKADVPVAWLVGNSADVGAWPAVLLRLRAAGFRHLVWSGRWLATASDRPDDCVDAETDVLALLSRIRHHLENTGDGR